MSSAYRGHWLNGSKATGYTAEKFDSDKKLTDAQGKELKLHMAGIKRAVDATKPAPSKTA
jgi:hypothetical protein